MKNYVNYDKLNFCIVKNCDKRKKTNEEISVKLPIN